MVAYTAQDHFVFLGDGVALMVSPEAALDMAHALNLAQASRLGTEPVAVVAPKAEEIKAEEIEPEDAFCKCGHRRFQHSGSVGCTARNKQRRDGKCDCSVFVQAPNQQEMLAQYQKSRPEAPKVDNPEVASEERRKANEMLLIVPLPIEAPLPLELAYYLAQLVQYGKKGQLAPREVGLASHEALERFKAEYEM